MNSVSLAHLELIIAFLECQHIGALWLCGDKTLSRKIVNAVTKLDIKLRSWLPLSWPHFVVCVPKLRELRVSHLNSDCFAGPLPVKGFSWRMIPLTVEIFHITGLDDQDNFILDDFSEDDVRPALQEFIISFLAKIPPHLPKFSLITPNLKTLSWSQRTFSCHSSPKLDLSVLPRCLTDLSMRFEIFGKVSFGQLKIDGSWPEGLKRLDFEAFPLFDWPDFPLSLTDINLHTAKIQQDWAQYPSLQHLQVGMRKQPVPNLPGLLSLGFLHEQNLYPTLWLPSSLTTLRIDSDGLTLSMEFAASLPRTLTRLEGEVALVDLARADEILSLLPPRMEYSLFVNAPTGTNTLPSALKTQRHLISLTLRTSNKKAIDLANLPPGLTNLDVADTTLRDLSHLPPSLKSLRLERVVIDIIAYFHLLPRGLTSLSVTTTKFRKFIDPSVIPPSLTDLNIECKGEYQEIWLCGLPRTLTTLRLSHVAGTSEMDFSTISWPSDLSYLEMGLDSDPSDGYKRILERLPRTLVALILHDESRRSRLKGLSNQDIPFLPRGLLELEIPPSPKLTIASRQLFPPNLNTLPF